MTRQRKLILLGLPLILLFLVNATCHKRRGYDDLLNSYEMVRFRLSEYRNMGGYSFDPLGLEKAEGLSEEVGGMLDRGNWRKASETIAQLEQTLEFLLEQMKSWDPDEDGLSNYAEYMLYGTSWEEDDTDGDGYFDGSEILYFETDPLDYCGVPIGFPVETAVRRHCPALEKLR